MKPRRLLPLILGLEFILAPALSAQTARQLWVQRYKRSPHSDNYATSVAVDLSGNVAVTGYSINARGDFDYYTAKYAAANGALIWQNRYKGSHDDFANSLVVDISGNVIVTGYSFNASDTRDCYTAKYAAANGALLWEQRYNGPTNGHDTAFSVAVGPSGDVAVTGLSGDASGNSDYYTAKYLAANGALLWEKRYDGSADGDDYAHSVVMDVAGDVIVTGGSNGIISGTDYYTVKYAAADGAVLWEQRYSGPGIDADIPYSVAVDLAGNVAVTGFSHNASHNADYYTAKYAATDGAVLWERRYNSPADGSDVANDVAFDAAGNVAVTGFSGNASGNLDYYTAKYAAVDGALLWERRFDGPANGLDFAVDVAMDAAGNVVVTGESLGLGTGLDYYTAKYAGADGALLWKKRYNGPANNHDRIGLDHPGGSMLALTADGGAVVTGATLDVVNYAYATVRYVPRRR